MSAVFFSNDEQKKLAMQTRDREAKKGKVETAILPLDRFYMAEDYHQKYYLRQSGFGKAFVKVYPKAADFANSTAVMRINAYLGGHGTKEQVRADLPKLGLTEAAGRELLNKVGD